MSWPKYGEFLAFAVVLVVIPGLDLAVVTKNTLAAGRRRGRWTALGVSSSNLAQGTAAAFGLSALIVKVQPLFESVKWAGVAYLAYLGVQALRSARRGEYAPLDGNGPASTAQNVAGWRQGFISNITNPKVLVFYLAVLPQFLTPGAGLGWVLLLAWSHAALSLAYLLVLVTGLHGARRLLLRHRVRRALDATTGAVLLGFGARLATEHVYGPGGLAPRIRVPTTTSTVRGCSHGMPRPLTLACFPAAGSSSGSTCPSIPSSSATWAPATDGRALPISDNAVYCWRLGH